MIGIYKITNKINNKVYIGQSVHIEIRFTEHKTIANNNNHHCYEYPLYRAIRKYGIENFVFEILEETTIENLTDREQYYINKFNSLVPNGYNQENALDSKKGEDCNFAVLTNAQANTIVDLLLNSNLLMKDIATMFNVSDSCVEDINKGRRRVRDNINYPIRQNAKSFAHSGENSCNALLTNVTVMKIRQRYVNEDLPTIYKDYCDLISYSGFKKICYGVTWKNLPVYKKREKQWINYN